MTALAGPGNGELKKICLLQELVFSYLVQFFPLPLSGDLLVLDFFFTLFDYSKGRTACDVQMATGSDGIFLLSRV